MKNTYLILALFCLAISVQAKNYAVLVAGSNSFFNYRHQADVFHAYQILVKYGIEAEDIITFAYDDIANDPSNPFPGQVFNKPSTGPGKDVYNGVVIDYSGEDVTPANFLAALKGDSAAVNGKKVLQSTSDDNVFIYFADHGGVGLIAFPSEYLYADDLVSTLKTLHTEKKYKQLVFYLEACESGSMFQKILPTNINIYATTAANADESSWGTYCSPDDTVNGQEIGSCLGDLYSVNFLENLESVDPAVETLAAQFTVVQNETNLSHVMQYGQVSIDTEVVGEFEGDGDSHGALVGKDEEFFSKKNSVDSRLIKFHYLANRHQKLFTEETRQELLDEIKSMDKFDSVFARLESRFNLDVRAPVGDIDFTCLKERVEIYKGICGNFSDYGLQYVRYIYNTCSQEVSHDDYVIALAEFCL